MNWEGWRKPVWLKHRFPEDHNWIGLQKQKPGKIPEHEVPKFHILPIKKFPPKIKPVIKPIFKPIAKPAPIEESKIIQIEESKDNYISENKWPICEENFDDIQSLINHSEIHFKPVIQDHKSTWDLVKEACPIWNRLYTINELINHWEIEHLAA